MASSSSGLEELELSGEEVERLRRAFADEEFRRLWGEYAAELADPAQRAIYEAEVVALERQRGVEAHFLHPEPGWVLRTSQAGARRCYLNICGHPRVGRPEARPEPGGSRWSLPHCLPPGREELAKGGRRLPVYDVLFHPDALRLARRSPRFRSLLHDTALDAVQKRFQPGLDRANARRLKGAKYKGVPRASLLRTPLPGGLPAPAGEGEGGGGSPLPPFPTPYAYPPPAAPRDPDSPPPEPVPAAATPRWTLRQRSYVDLQDYRHSRDSAPSPVPRELEVTVELPLLSSAAQAQLEVRGKELRLDSRRPAYSLRLRLPYPVDEDAGRAAFDKAKRRLVVTLPVLRPPQPAFLPGPAAEEEEPPGSGSGDSPSSCAAPADPLPERSSPGQQLCSAAHVGTNAMELPVGTNHVELPVCADQSGPGATGTSRPRGESPLDDRLGATPGLAETNRRVLLDAANGNASGAPEGATDNKSHESECVFLAPEVCVGNSVERPACLDPAVVQMKPGTDMDLKQGPGDANAVPSSELDDASTPSIQLGGTSSDHPVAKECHNGSHPHQNLETCTGTDGTQHPSNCSHPVAPVCSPSTDLSVTAVGATNSPPGPPLLSGTDLGVDPEPALSPLGSLVSPLPPSSSIPTLCPPFQCTQDEEALVLLLQVQGIDPQSLKGEVGAHHYRVSFASKDSVSYALFLQLPAENKLTSPETSISVSLDNAAIHLAKAPDTTGLWTKLYFGLNEDAMQEKLFVTEDNVSEFLDSLPRSSCPGQPEMEHQPLIEVLEVSEGKSRIRLKAPERNGPEAGPAEEEVNPGREVGEHPSRAENRPMATNPAGNHTPQTEKASDSLTAAETKEPPAAWGRGRCGEPDPAGSSQKPQITKPQESRARRQPQLGRGERAGAGEELCPGSTENGGPPAPVLRETDARDGSVQLIRDHTTRCAVSFQNPLLYELD
ncbi:protein kintoun [Heteronotia binoei]|uniref:protein kintoun n=1 Tax=Heteronotia binoei TaxID=13085 RepID=UPI00292D4FE9|nr:protein kintoun [Heteronotia binoei]